MNHWSEYKQGIPRHQQQIVQQYTASGYWRNVTIFQAFRQAAERYPQRIAVITDTQKITYSELLNRVERIACAFYIRGVVPASVVTAQLPNWLEYVETALAAARLGAMFCPLSIRLRGEIEALLELSASPLLVIPAGYATFDHQAFVQSLRPNLPHLRHVLVARGATVQEFESFDEVRHSSLIALPSLPDANDPWLLEFTSGTTAAPKGVVRTHNNTLFSLRAMADFFENGIPGGDDVALAAQPIHFIYLFYLCVLFPLLNGLTTVLQDGIEPEETLRLIAQHRVTFLTMVPSLVDRLLQARQACPWDLPTLRWIQISGDVVGEERKSKLMSGMNCDVREVYGLTECTWPVGCRPGAPVGKKLTATGEICPGVDLKLLDGSGRQAESGEVGELYLRGPSLTPGYYRNPDATRSAIDDEGWFSTGDLATLDGEGYVRIVGRKKDIIIRGGINVLPQEVEEWLAKHPGVAHVAVFGVSDPNAGEQIWACAVPRPGVTLTSGELQAFLKGKIASYKVPEQVFIVNDLPVSSTGKILRRQLKERVMGELSGRP